MIGNLLAFLGLLMFACATAARFLDEKSIACFAQIPFFGNIFTAAGNYVATACVLLLAAIALMKSGK